MGIRLPPELLSQELFEDTSLFTFLPDEEPIAAGDLFFFGKEIAFVDKRKLHLAIATGEKTDCGDDLLIHTSFRSGIETRPLPSFLETKRFKLLFGRKRYIGLF